MVLDTIFVDGGIYCWWSWKGVLLLPMVLKGVWKMILERLFLYGFEKGFTVFVDFFLVNVWGVLSAVFKLGKCYVL